MDSFVETDDIVRRNLDRKEKVNQIRTSVNTALHQSSNMVQQARTPTKSTYGEQQFQADRVSTFSGNAGVQRTSYSGANVATYARGGMERGGTFEQQRPAERVVQV